MGVHRQHDRVHRYVKVALLGTAPSSKLLAPFNDPSWEIWACSPGSMDLPRIDLFFEMHDMDRLRASSPYKPYLEWLKNKKVVMQKPDPEYPASEAFPIDEMTALFGGYFWNSTISYMLALAISREPTEVGIWGVDMTANEEYYYQRSGCQYFIQKCADLGIGVRLPSTSDIGEPPPRYGYCEASPMWRKIESRKAELSARVAVLAQQKAQAAAEETLLTGALEDLDYISKTWAK